MYIRKTVPIIAFATLSILFSPQRSHAAPGDLDLSFGTGGQVSLETFVVSPFPTFTSCTVERASDIAVQSTGVIAVAAEVTCTGGDSDFAIIRYDANGTLLGKNTTELGGYDDSSEIDVQTDNKLVVAGRTSADGVTHNFAIARYNANGTLDTTYNNPLNTAGAGGKRITDLGGDDFVTDLTLQGDNKAVVVGYTSTNNNFTMARYTSGGLPDSAFGTVTTDMGGLDLATAVAIQPDGKIVVGGSTRKDLYSSFKLALARYCSNGLLDNGTNCGTPAFGTGGKSIITLPFSFVFGDMVRSIDFQPATGKIIVGLSHPYTPERDFTVVRLNTNGSLDTTFGSSGVGKASAGSSTYDTLLSLGVQSDGKIVAVGETSSMSNQSPSGPSDFAVVRFCDNGKVDNGTNCGTAGFGDLGWAVDPFGGTGDPDGALGVTLQSDGKIVTSGYCENNGQPGMGISRYFASEPPPIGL